MRALLFLNIKMRYLNNGIISHFVTSYNFNIPIVKIRFMNITLRKYESYETQKWLSNLWKAFQGVKEGFLSSLYWSLRNSIKMASIEAVCAGKSSLGVDKIKFGWWDIEKANYKGKLLWVKYRDSNFLKIVHTLLRKKVIVLCFLFVGYENR